MRGGGEGWGRNTKAFVFCSFVFCFTFSETPKREENDYTSTKQTETAEQFGISDLSDLKQIPNVRFGFFLFFFI